MKYLLSINNEEINVYNTEKELREELDSILESHREFPGVENINIDDCCIIPVPDNFTLSDSVIPF